MVQFSKKVLAAWAAVVIAEEIDLNLDESHVAAEVSDADLDAMDFDDEELGPEFGADGMDPMGGLGGLFGAFGGAPSEETKEIFATHDTDGDGSLDAGEFSKFLGETMWEMSEGQRGGKDYIEVGQIAAEEAEAGMAEMDKNGDGKITKEEYTAGVGAAPGDGFLEMLDSNKTGRLEIEEFGFIVSMFNMSKGDHSGHDHAAHGHGHDHHDHSTCGGHHGHGHGHNHSHAEPEAHEHEQTEEAEHEHEVVEEQHAHEHEHEEIDTEAHEHEHEHEHADLQNSSCAAGDDSTSCCAGDHCESAVVYELHTEEPNTVFNNGEDEDSHDEL